MQATDKMSTLILAEIEKPWRLFYRREFQFGPSTPRESIAALLILGSNMDARTMFLLPLDFQQSGEKNAAALLLINCFDESRVKSLKGVVVLS